MFCYVRKKKQTKKQGKLQMLCVYEFKKACETDKGSFRSFICGFIQLLTQVIQKSVATLNLQPIFVYSL